MASEEQVAAGSPPSASVVGNAFVHQYYNILYQSPGLVYRFYQENSRLGRPEAHGLMCSITTMQAIKEKILSMDYGGVRAEIKTIDAQESLSGGVIVLVTGYLIGKDNVRRNFTQSFFLATQDKGYFVLNDIFRYIEEDNYLHGNQGLPNGNNVPLSEQEVPPASEENVPDQSEEPPEEDEVIEEVYNPSDHEEGSVLKDETPNYEVIDEGQNIAETKAVESVYSGSQAEAPKKSYASIVKVKKENVAPSPVKAPAPIKAVLPIEEHAAPAPTPLPAAENPVAPSTMPETSSTQETEVDGHSIYVKSLPLSATSAELEEEFKRFGPIKPGRVQVRSHRQQGFCFGFIEFEAAGSVQSAIKASPVMIGGRQAFVEEKRPTGSRGSNRGWFSGRGGNRNEGSRGHGGYGGGRGYGRGDFSYRTEFGGRGGSRGGSSSRGDGSTYQRVDHGVPTGGRGTRSGSAASRSPVNVVLRVSTPS